MIRNRLDCLLGVQMRRPLSCLLLLCCVLADVSASAQRRQKQDRCDDPQSQAEMNICADKEFRAADAVLNRVYNQLSAKLDEGERAKLKEVELTWLKYRDAECEFEASFYEGGSIQPLIRSTCLTHITKTRAADIRTQIKDLDR